MMEASNSGVVVVFAHATHLVYTALAGVEVTLIDDFVTLPTDG